MNEPVIKENDISLLQNENFLRKVCTVHVVVLLGSSGAPQSSLSSCGEGVLRQSCKKGTQKIYEWHKGIKGAITLQWLRLRPWNYKKFHECLTAKCHFQASREMEKKTTCQWFLCPVREDELDQFFGNLCCNLTNFWNSISERTPKTEYKKKKKNCINNAMVNCITIFICLYIYINIMCINVHHIIIYH